MIDFAGLQALRAIARLYHGWRSNRLAPLPTKGAAIIYSNHTCSADPAFLNAGCARWLSFVIAQEYYHIPRLRPLFDFLHCVPAARNGKDPVALRRCLRRLEEGGALCIFPEGNLSNAGKRRPRAGKHGIALLALRTRAPVYPAFISGGPQETEVLPSWLKPSRVHVTYGPPIDLSAYYDRPIDRKLIVEVTDLLMNRVAALDGNKYNGR